MLVERAGLLTREQKETLKKMPRFKEYTLIFGDNFLKIVDAASFLSSYREIMEENIYRFKADTTVPVVIDGGANIGLSTFYFKMIYPGAIIYAFEPAPAAFKALSQNVKSLHLENVFVHPKALWKERTTLNFRDQGADGGRVVKEMDRSDLISVQTVRLRDYLNEPIDFLKLDIEGSEYAVLQDCADRLCNVKQIFIEYHGYGEEEQDLDVLLKLLREEDFRYYLKPVHVPENPYRKIDCHFGYDMQLNIFGVRKE